MITLYLCTDKGEGDNFFGISANEVFTNNDSYKLFIAKYYSLLNVECICLLLVTEDQENKIFKITGKY